jgi:hypothetical protein
MPGFLEDRERAATRERTRRWRARQKAANGGPARRLPGRRPESGPVAARISAQRRRRRAVLQKTLVIRCLRQLLRLRILARPNLRNCSNVRALMRLEPLLRGYGLTAQARAAVLILVTLSRRPRLIAELVLPATWGAQNRWLAAETLIRVRAMLLTCSVSWGSSFWHGPVRLNTEAALNRMNTAALLSASSMLSSRSGVCHTDDVIRELCKMPKISTYMAFATARVVAPVMGVRLTQARSAASSMSEHVGLLSDVVSFQKLASLDSQSFQGADLRDAGNVANLLCGLTGVLRAEGLLRPLEQYGTRTAVLKRDLCSKAFRSFVDTLSRCEPLDEDSLNRGRGDDERRLVDDLVPGAPDGFHCSIDWPQTMSRIRGQLRKRGWSRHVS